MKRLTLSQLKKWEPCNGHDWIGRMQKEYGKTVEWPVVVEILSKEKEWGALLWLIGKRLEKLTKRQVCAFVYRCAHRSLKYARKRDVAVLRKAISFAKIFAETGEIDVDAAKSAAKSAAWSAWSAARSAKSAARSAEFKWQFDQLLSVEEELPKKL
jgi:hypothetical protein